jgi:hypothetical protein
MPSQRLPNKKVMERRLLERKVPSGRPEPIYGIGNWVTNSLFTHPRRKEVFRTLP